MDGRRKFRTGATHITSHCSVNGVGIRLTRHTRKTGLNTGIDAYVTRASTPRTALQPVLQGFAPNEYDLPTRRHGRFVFSASLMSNFSMNEEKSARVSSSAKRSIEINRVGKRPRDLFLDVCIRACGGSRFTAELSPLDSSVNRRWLWDRFGVLKCL